MNQPETPLPAPSPIDRSSALSAAYTANDAAQDAARSLAYRDTLAARFVEVPRFESMLQLRDRDPAAFAALNIGVTRTAFASYLAERAVYQEKQGESQ